MKKIILALTTAGGLGYFPKMPGTIGTIPGILLVWLLKDLSVFPYLLTIITLILLSVWVSSLGEQVLGKKDPSIIVIDEVVGMMVAISFLPFNLPVIIAGFLLFRLFDIWKPYPVRLCQDHLPRGWGIVMDDVVAGVLANLILQGAIRIFPTLPFF